MTKIITEASPLERLAEHLAARPFLTGNGDAVQAVANWLDYSLNRCGLVVVEEQLLARSTAQEPALDDDAELRERMIEAALILQAKGYREHAEAVERIANRLQAKAPETCRKVACGLRQIAESMAQNTLTKYRAVQEWQDRVNGFAAELEAESNHRERNDGRG